ncbi:MAG: LytTR family DNA-binding domain-containing protein [Ekhidna sp.]|uniref:LytR/AlgR family response regulator transcription factor n=1 Tax=Ekhidna sp. TaxID=2608089 RepID=UPI0032EC5231
MNAVIIEDEQLTADRLKNLVGKHTSIEVIKSIQSVKSAIAWFQENESPDLIFLDIQLGDGTGFDVLESLSTYPQVIFTTAFDKYVLDAFKYNSVDYLLKPVQPEKLVQAVEKLKKVRGQNNLSDVIGELKSQIQTPYKQKFLVKTGLKYLSLSIEDIAYFYSESSTSYIKTTSGDSHIIDHSLDDVEKHIDPIRFFRVNRHMIICDKCITSIDSYFNNRLLLSLSPAFKEHVIVSREKVKTFKSWLDR